MDASERRFLKWLGTYCSPAGTEVGKVSAVIGKLVRKGFVERRGKFVKLTEAGRNALLATGWQPSEEADLP